MDLEACPEWFFTALEAMTLTKHALTPTKSGVSSVIIIDGYFRAKNFMPRDLCFTVPMSEHSAAIHQALATIRLEADTLYALTRQLESDNTALALAITTLQATVAKGGHVVLTGMGKSGHIAKKISATFASTGTPSFFLHPAEALHGDLGMVGTNDALLALSYSGESAEILAFLPHILRMKIPLITMTGKDHSTMAKLANIALPLSVEKEACPHNLAPTCSTTAQLALGDALALALLVDRGFSAEDFARFHPGGSLGKKLVTVADIMHLGREVPVVDKTAPLATALTEMTRGGLGMTAIVDDVKTSPTKLIGVFTDGDLRRQTMKGAINPNTPINTVMSENPTSIKLSRLAAEAVAMMEEKKINQLLVVDENGGLVGAINMHDLLKHRVV